MTFMGDVADADLAVDLALVLAVDCSSSVDAADFKIQMDGIAAALRHPAVAGAIAAGEHQRILLTLMLWSNPATQRVEMPWRILATADDLERAARRVEAIGRDLPPGGTGLAAALDYAVGLLAATPLAARRRMIDISGDGIDNEGGDMVGTRSRAVAQGITINGLPVLSGSKLLLLYYQQQVIGGRDAFVEPAETVLAFKDTFLRKLLREIGAAVS